MKRTKYIWVLIAVFFLCSSRTCEEGKEETQEQKDQYTLNLINSVKEVFASDSLSDNLLRAYEMTAKEKLIDFTDYLRIISDTTININFRQQAIKLIRDQFISDSIEFYSCNKSVDGSKPITLKELLVSRLDEGDSYRIIPLQINISKPLSQCNDSVFTGSLLFNCKYIPVTCNDTVEILSENNNIEIYLKRNLNFFGNEYLKVWEVKFGKFCFQNVF